MSAEALWVAFLCALRDFVLNNPDFFVLIPFQRHYYGATQQKGPGPWQRNRSMLSFDTCAESAALAMARRQMHNCWLNSLVTDRRKPLKCWSAGIADWFWECVAGLWAISPKWKMPFRPPFLFSPARLAAFARRML